MTLRTVLLSLQALLSAAEPDDPQDAVVARQYKEQRKVFWQTAKHWTNIYARGLYTFIFITALHRYIKHCFSCNAYICMNTRQAGNTKS